MLRSGPGMSLTREDLRLEFERFTREDLKTELAHYATKDDLASGLADTRRYMQIVGEDLKSTMHALFDGLAGQIEALDQRLSTKVGTHEHRIDSLEHRVTLVESRPRKRT